MDLELKDKVAIVGGASKGLGRACAEVLAQEGVKVAICSRSQADLDKAAKEIGRDVFFARMSREALPHLKRHKAGRIINILASTVYQPIPNLALSGATRMGVVAF